MTKLAFSVDEFAEAHGICRATVYKEINEGRLQTMKVGRRRLISEESATSWRRLMGEGI